MSNNIERNVKELLVFVQTSSDEQILEFETKFNSYLIEMNEYFIKMQRRDGNL